MSKYDESSERKKKKPSGNPDQTLDVLNLSDQKTQLTHILDAEHTDKAESVVFLRFIE